MRYRCRPSDRTPPRFAEFSALLDGTATIDADESEASDVAMTSDLERALYEFVPADGRAIRNLSLRSELELRHDVTEAQFHAVRQRLAAKDMLRKGRGRGVQRCGRQRACRRMPKTRGWRSERAERRLQRGSREGRALLVRRRSCSSRSRNDRMEAQRALEAGTVARVARLSNGRTPLSRRD